MEELLNEIRVVYPDAEINAVLSAIPDGAVGVSCAVRFNHSEELFLELGGELTVPRFPIHHDIHSDSPSAPYAYALRDLVKQLAATLPEIFHGLTYYFDPAEPLKPRFYRLYKVESSIYLFLLKVDLVFRHFQGEVLEQATNDQTPAYRTRHLFIESEFIPLEAVMWELGKAKAFKVRQLISNTWIGETGRGYLLHGIWMDDDLSKFFSKIILPEGLRSTYPFYPLFCKYKTICAEAVPPALERRKRMLPLLHRAISFLSPEMERIQNSLKNGFSETMPAFVELRERVPVSWKEILKGISMRSYLNDRDLKEYALDIADDAG